MCMYAIRIIFTYHMNVTYNKPCIGVMSGI